jgi:hypothetical protein
VCRRHLGRWDGHAVVEAPLPPGWTDAEMVMQASDGALWLAKHNRVVRWQGQAITGIAEQQGLAGKRVLQEGRQGAVWIGADDGAAVWRQGRVQVFRASLPAAETSSLYEDAEGTVWLGTKGAGLRRLRDGVFTGVTTASGLPTNWIIQILEDDRGGLWMSGSKGLYWASKRELDDVAAGRRPTLHASSYDSGDGVLIRTESFGHPAGWKDRDGRLWFATHGGVAIVEPAALRNHPAPRVVLEEVRVGDRRIGGAGRAVLGRGARDLQARLEALSFAAPETIAFRHRLLGMDRDWVDDGPGRSVHYPGSSRAGTSSRSRRATATATGAPPRRPSPSSCALPFTARPGSSWPWRRRPRRCCC